MNDERAVIVETFVDAWNRRDLPTALELIGDDFEYVNPPNAMEPGTRRGTDGVTDVMSKQWEGLGDDARLEIDRIHHRGDHVISEARLSRGMPGSTTRLEVKAVMRWTFEDNRLVRMEVVGAGSSFDESLAETGVS
ncbi:MAG TPA: nuclear transport factor 2 family protein [Solirubrobacterales bacterium]|nr:nuclear transport factor 2 family protein [Solirubrobacterales bacterium]